MDDGHLHFVMLPWLAMGHLLPFLELSKRLARKGHRISFLTTPRNIHRLLPNLPSDLSDAIHLIELPLPHVQHLPDSAEASVDLPSDDLRPYLRIAYDSLSHRLPDILTAAAAAAAAPDWILYDYASHWLPAIAAKHNIPCAYLGLFSSAMFGFIGPPHVLRGEGGARTAPEHFTVVPEWVPFTTTVRYRPYEARELFDPCVVPDASGVSESYRFAMSIEGSAMVAVRSCRELENDWLRLLPRLYRKPVVPIGLFPPSPVEGDDGRWAGTFEWLHEQREGSVVYAAFGSEAKLREEQVREIARGLELSGLAFVWAARAAAPEGFEERTEGRGVVCREWAPQVRLLGHGSVGGFLTHGGWNSVVEGLAAGTAMVLLPLMFDQGLNARLVVEKGMGVEVARDEDGSFTGEGIAKSLRLAMVDEEGEVLRAKARECKQVYGDEKLQEKYVEEFVEHLRDYRRQHAHRVVETDYFCQSPCFPTSFG